MDKKLRLQLIFQASGNTRGYLGGVRSETDRTTKALGQARERVQALQRATKDVGAFRAMEDRLAGTREEMTQARTEAMRLGAAMDAADRPTRQLARAFDIATSRVKALDTQQAGQVRGLGELKTKLDAAGISTDALGAHERRLARDLGAANQELAEQGRRMNDVADQQRRMAAARGRHDRTQGLAAGAAGAGAGAMAATLAMAAPIGLAISEAMTLETAMADVRKVVDFPTPRAFRELTSDARTLSTQVPLTGAEIATIMANAGQAGFAAGKPWEHARRELNGFARDAGMMGVAFDVPAEEAGQMMATWRTAFSLTQKGVVGLADKINYLGNTGPAKAAQISNVVTRIGALGGVAGLAEGEVAALGATIVGMGVQEEIAATGIKNTMLALTKGTAATRVQREAFAALGIEAGEVSRRMQVDAGGTIVDVMERISRLSPDRQAGILTQMFGSESVAAIAPMMSNLDLLKANLTKVGDESRFAGSMQAEFNGVVDTTASGVGRATNAARALGGAFGDSLTPDIDAASQKFTTMANQFRAFAEGNPGLTRGIALVAVALSAITLGFAALALGAAAVLAPFALLQFAWAGALPLLSGVAGGIAGATAAVSGFTAALLANPITWVVLAVVALAAGAYLMYRNWAPISAWFTGIWRGIRAGVSTALRAIGSAFMTFSPAGVLIRVFAAVWPALARFGSRFATMGGQLITGLVNGIVGGIPRVVQAVIRGAASIVAGFRRRLGIASPSRVFAQLGDYTMQGMGLGIDRSADQPLRRMRAFAGAMMAAGAVAVPAAAFAGGASPGARPAIEFQSAGRMLAPSTVADGARGGFAPVITITVNAAPGMKEADVARLVADEIRKLFPDGGGGGGRFGDDDFGEAP